MNASNGAIPGAYSSTRHAVLALGAALCLAGCATSSVSPDQAAQVPQSRIFATGQVSPSSGRVIVTRDSGFLGKGCSLGFHMDGQLAATFETGETASFAIPAKSHLLGVSQDGCFHTGGRREIEVSLAPGETKYYRLSMHEGGDASISPTSY